jgi:hypothetical protein
VVSYGYSVFVETIGPQGLAAGNYFVRTTNYSGFVDELYNNISCPDQSCNPTSGTPVPVSNGSDTGNIDFALQ